MNVNGNKIRKENVTSIYSVSKAISSSSLSDEEIRFCVQKKHFHSINKRNFHCAKNMISKEH